MNRRINWTHFKNIYHIYQKKYEFRFCQLYEIPRVIEFIDQYWQKEHIFTKSKALLDWQHLDQKNNRYNFVMAIDKETDEIHGMIGFILSSLYDDSILHPIRWGVIWKVREDIDIRGLGLSLKYYLEIYAPASYVGGVGLSKYSKKINRKLGEKVGKLKLYYMLNRTCQTFDLADQVTKENFYVPDVCKSPYYLKEINGECLLDHSKDYFRYIPEYKSTLYYINRYHRHPLYKYHFLEICNREDKAMACMIWRKCEANGKSAIVIVDYIGQGCELVGLYDEFQSLLRNNYAEYISFYEYGLDDQALSLAGFLNQEDCESGMPLYFEPFIRKNVDLDYHFYTERQTDRVVIYKGDADQDRPNQI